MAAIGERKSCRTEPARQRRKARRDKRGAIDERRPPRDTRRKTRRRRRLTGQATPPCSPLECPAALAAKKTVCRSPPVAAISSKLAIASLREPPRSPPALAAPFRPSSNREKSRFPRTRATRETASRFRSSPRSPPGDHGGLGGAPCPVHAAVEPCRESSFGFAARAGRRNRRCARPFAHLRRAHPPPGLNPGEPGVGREAGFWRSRLRPCVDQPAAVADGPARTGALLVARSSPRANGLVDDRHRNDVTRSPIVMAEPTPLGGNIVRCRSLERLAGRGLQAISSTIVIRRLRRAARQPRRGCERREYLRGRLRGGDRGRDPRRIDRRFARRPVEVASRIVAIQPFEGSEIGRRPAGRTRSRIHLEELELRLSGEVFGPQRPIGAGRTRDIVRLGAPRNETVCAGTAGAVMCRGHALPRCGRLADFARRLCRAADEATSERRAVNPHDHPQSR
jgi:hypothetical protein